MDTNDSLRLASLWHSMHAISQQLSPIMGCSGIELLEADNFDLHCFQSLTGKSHGIFFDFVLTMKFEVLFRNQVFSMYPSLLFVFQEIPRIEKKIKKNNELLKPWFALLVASPTL